MLCHRSPLVPASAALARTCRATVRNPQHARVYVCLWYAVVVYYVEGTESLPVHITNASLTHDISSRLEFSF